MVDASFDNVPVAFGLDPELWSWIWNFMREPDSVRVSTVDTIVTLTWVNRHGRRAIDGTLVWRRNANTDAVVRAFTLGPQETSIVDTTTSGQWRYELRHRQDKLHAVMEAEMWSDPVYVNVGYPAPQGLWCIGHFAAVVDCTWTNGTNAAPVEVLRDGTSLTVLPAGSTSHSDATLVRNSSYTYTVRHTENGYPSPSSSPVTVTAAPQPPSLDSCGDSSPTAIHCYWSGWEGAAQTEVWRSTGARFSLIATKAPGVTDHLDEGLTTGTTYYYKVRYLQNGEVSDWSNTQVQDAGGIGPQSVGDKKF
ncbi:MAG: hypothetical protein HY701_03490 [Gemmatimonadetes bacterium]|nr:hypothetical protein [Gemmatimonadota bacterium]